MKINQCQLNESSGKKGNKGERNILRNIEIVGNYRIILVYKIT